VLKLDTSLNFFTAHDAFMPRLLARQACARDILKKFLDHHTTRIKQAVRQKFKLKRTDSSSSGSRNWSDLLGSDWSGLSSSSDLSASSTDSFFESTSGDEDMPDLFPAGYPDSDEEDESDSTSSGSQSGEDGDDEEGWEDGMEDDLEDPAHGGEMGTRHS
jgi:hypothetical protein